MGARWTHAHGLDRLTGADPRGAPACTILDTDIGTFADDTFALGFLLRLPAMALKLVVTASHDTVGRARVAAKHLTLAGADHIPIGVGIKTSGADGRTLRLGVRLRLESVSWRRVGRRRRQDGRDD